MRGKLMFGAGLGIGYLLGTRAGRERYKQISDSARRFWETDTVQEAASTVQEQAGRLYDGGKKMMSDQAHKMREHRHDKQHHGKQHPDNEFRRRGFADRNRGRSDSGAPVGYPATPGSPTNTSPTVGSPTMSNPY
jgi:hypothetical protein